MEKVLNPSIKWNSMADAKRQLDISIERMEYVFPTRLSDDTYSGILSFMKATNGHTSMEQLQKALVSYYSAKLVTIRNATLK